MKEKLQKIVSSAQPSAVILDSDKGCFRDWEYADYEVDRERDEKKLKKVIARFKATFDAAVSTLQEIFGQPDVVEHEWNDQRPKWASGHFYALWRSDAESFVSVFMWWENPEDPPILLAGRAAATLLSQDNDPWNWEWMKYID